jgi:hypothetical protein
MVSKNLWQDMNITMAQPSLKLRANGIQRQKATAHRVTGFQQRLLRLAVDEGLNLQLRLRENALAVRVLRGASQFGEKRARRPLASSALR